MRTVVVNGKEITLSITKGDTISQIKSAARRFMAEIEKETMVQLFGEENVSSVGSNEISVNIDTVLDELGLDTELCVNLKPTAKEFQNRKTGKSEYVAYNREAMAKAYENKLTEAAQKAADKKNK